MTVDTADLKVEIVPLDSLKLYPGNPRRGDVSLIADSIQAHGQYRPLIVQRATGHVLAGNHTLRALQQLERTEAAVTYLDVDDTQAAKIVAVDNRSSDQASYDVGELLDLLNGLPDLAGTGYSQDDIDQLLAGLSGAEREAARHTLAQRFVVPPFSVLDTRQGYWQERRRAWLALGIQSELGRGAASDHEVRTYAQDLMKGEHVVGDRQPQHVQGPLMRSDSGNDPAYYYKKQAVEQRLGRKLTTEEFQSRYYFGPDAYQYGTSVFDPVLCELVYRWWCPPGGSVLDPFAGGSVRGIVASRLGLDYTGIDLSQAQIDANVAQGLEIIPERVSSYIHGDARDLLPQQPPKTYDLIFTCPPYFDLERYSEDPRDLSTMDDGAYRDAYREIILAADDCLRTGRFAVLVVSEVRGPGGAMRGLIPLTIEAAETAGWQLYNEAALVNAVGSLAVRVGRQFAASRKLGRTHQSVLVFRKGDPPIKDWGPVQTGDIEAAEE